MFADSIDYMMVDTDIIYLPARRAVCLYAVPTNGVVNEIIGNFIRTITVNVNAMVFKIGHAIRLIIDIAYVIPYPKIAFPFPIVGQTGCPAFIANLTTLGSQLIVDDTPMASFRICIPILGINRPIVKSRFYF